MHFHLICELAALLGSARFYQENQIREHVYTTPLVQKIGKETYLQDG
jgi:hypothetical protein